MEQEKNDSIQDAEQIRPVEEKPKRKRAEKTSAKGESVFKKINEKVKESSEKVKEQTEKLRIDAPYEQPDRPDNMPYDEIEAPDLAAPRKEKEGAAKYAGSVKKEVIPETTMVYWRIIANIAISIVGLILILWLLPKAIRYFLPFVVAIVISLIAYPLVKFLKEKLRINQKVGTGIVVVIVVGLVGLALWGILDFLYDQIKAFTDNKDAIFETIDTAIINMGDRFSDIVELLPQNIRNIFTGTQEAVQTVEAVEESVAQTVETLEGTVVQSVAQESKVVTILKEFLKGLDISIGKNSEESAISGAVGKTADIVLGIIVGFLATLFFINQHDSIVKFLRDHTPKETQEYFTLIKNNFKKAIGGYFRAQFLIMLVVFVIIFVWLLCMRVPYSALIALGVSFLDFLPAFGMGAVFWPWAIIDLFVGRYTEAILIFVLYLVCQLVRQLLQPKLVGDAVEMNPLLTLFFMYVGYKTANLFGLILGIPIGMIIISLYKIGAFDRLVKGVKILAKGINEFRKY